MKIALIFTGVPRLLKESMRYFLNAFDTKNIDIYCYMWKTQEYQLMKNYVDMKDSVFTEPIDFSDRQQSGGLSHHSFFYGLQLASDCFKSYIHKHNLYYDYIIRTRVDIRLLSYDRIQFESLKFKNIYVAGNHWIKNDLFDDCISVMSQENYFKIYGSIYDYFSENVHLYTDNPHAEQVLYDQVKRVNLLESIHKISPLNFLLTRVCIESTI